MPPCSETSLSERDNPALSSKSRNRGKAVSTSLPRLQARPRTQFVFHYHLWRLKCSFARVRPGEGLILPHHHPVFKQPNLRCHFFCKLLWLCFCDLSYRIELIKPTAISSTRAPIAVTAEPERSAASSDGLSDACMTVN